MTHIEKIVLPVSQDDDSVLYNKTKFIEKKVFDKKDIQIRESILSEYSIEKQLNILRKAIVQINKKLNLENSALDKMCIHIEESIGGK